MVHSCGPQYTAIVKLPLNIYMVGIGGIGMSALAQLFVHQGKHVDDSDRKDSLVTAMLAPMWFTNRVNTSPIAFYAGPRYAAHALAD